MPRQGERLASSRLYRLAGGLSVGYLQAFVAALAALWLTPYYLRHVGQQEFGLWLVSGQLLGYMALADLGIVALLPREIAHATGSDSDDPEKVSRVISESSTVILWQLPLVAVLGGVAWMLVGQRWPPLASPFGFATLVLVLSFPLRMFAAALQGLQDLAYLSAIQFFSWIASVVVGVASVYAGFGLNGLVAGWAVTQLLVPAFAWRRLRQRFPTALPGSMTMSWSTTGATRLKRGLWVSLNQVAQVFLSGTDLIVVGWLLGPSAVVIYSCTARLATLLASQPQMFMQMAVPALSELKAGASRERLFDVASTMSQAMLLCSGAIACLVLGVNRGFVQWWVGSEHYGGPLLTALILLSMLLRHLNVGISYTLYSLGFERHLAVTAITDGVVTLLLMLPLLSFFGLAGAVLAPIAGVAVISLPSNVRALAGEAGISTVEALRPLASWSTRCAVLGAVILVAATFIVPMGIWLVPAITVIAFAYGATMIPVMTTPPIGPHLTRIFTSIRAGATPLVRRIGLSAPNA